MPVVFLHHGVKRDGANYRDYWLPHVDPGGVLAISIEFPEESFPRIPLVQLWQPARQGRHGNPRVGMDVRCRLSAFRCAPRAGDNDNTAIWPVWAFGGWAICASHAVFWLPRQRCSCRFGECRHLCDARSGDRLAVGSGATRMTAADLPALLRFPLTIMAGTKDTKTTGRFFPKGPKALRQGPHRHARAHTYSCRRRKAAAERCAFRWPGP